MPAADYYHTTRNNTATYEETFSDLRARHKALALPYAYYQLDSYFYPKGKEHGMIEWTGNPDMFPTGGLPGLAQRLGTRFVAHSRWLSPQTVYLANATALGGFYTGGAPGPGGLSPADPAEFFGYVIGQAAREWGLVTYEQDWTFRCFLAGLPTFGTHVDAAGSWDVGMGAAAAAAGAGVAYGTGTPSDLMQSVYVPTASFLFATQNPACPSVECPQSWTVGRVSVLARALGVAPFKDTFWSTAVQPGNPWGPSGTFPNHDLHALVSVLSGPVGPGDAIGSENATLIMRTCASNGLLLKPDRPAAAIDTTLLPSWPGGELWAGHTAQPGVAASWAYVLGAQLVHPTPVTPADVGLPPPAAEGVLGASPVTAYVAYDLQHGRGVL